MNETEVLIFWDYTLYFYFVSLVLHLFLYLRIKYV